MNSDIITKSVDMTFLEWSHRRNSSGTAGTFLKAIDIVNHEKRYYKMSDYDNIRGVLGHECINELIVDRLLTILGIRHVSYHLVNARVHVSDSTFDTYICYSTDFKKPGESKIAFDDYYDLNKESGESPLDFAIRKGWEQYLYEMIVADFITINRDRHGANIEVLKSADGVLPAPLYDHGLSFVFSCHTDEEIAKFDAMADIPVQSFTGGRSLFENLKLIPHDRLPRLRRLESRDKDIIFEELDSVITPIHIHKIWEIITSRWRYYENLRNS